MISLPRIATCTIDFTAREYKPISNVIIFFVASSASKFLFSLNIMTFFGLIWLKIGSYISLCKHDETGRNFKCTNWNLEQWNLADVENISTYIYHSDRVYILFLYYIKFKFYIENKYTYAFNHSSVSKLILLSAVFLQKVDLHGYTQQPIICRSIIW